MGREQPRLSRSVPPSAPAPKRRAGPHTTSSSPRLLRSRALSLDTALANAVEALNLLRAAEASLAEMTALLAELRRLAQRAAEQPVEAEKRCALQEEAAGVLSAMDRISQEAAYGRAKLLDGSAGVAATTLATQHVLCVTPRPSTPAGYVDLQITQAASRALAVCASCYDSPDDPVQGAGEVTLNGVLVGRFEPAAHTVKDVLDAVAEAGPGTGVVPRWAGGGAELRHVAFGSNFGVVLAETGTVLNQGRALVRYGEDAAAVAMYGDGSIEKLDAGAGLVLRGRPSGFTVALTEAGNRVGLKLPRAAYVTHRQLTLRLGAQQEREVTLSLPNLATSHLGIIAPLSTMDLSTAAEAAEAVTAVDEASGQVEGLRRQLARTRHEDILPGLDELTEARRELRAGRRLEDPELERELVQVICSRIAQEPAAAGRTQAHCLPHNVAALLR